MLLSKSFQGFVLNCTNLNFSQYRKLRGIRKSFEAITLPNSRVESELESTKTSKESSPGTYESTTSNLQTQNSNKLSELKPDSIITYNIAAYLKQSESLQQLFKLGVDFSKIEKRKGLAEFVLKLDFENDVKSHLTFLHDIGVPANKFGEFITQNPLIFKVGCDDLQTRINYLETKNFKEEQIQRIVTVNPFWLMFSTKRIDNRLGYFQKNFKLSGNDVRFLATKEPKLITYKMDHIRENFFCIKEEMGFDEEELKCLILSKPKLWMMDHNELVERFDYIHNTMKLSHDMIIKFPEILTSRRFRTHQRHQYLKELGKAQYEPDKVGYISPKSLVEGTDEEFVNNVTKTDMKTYELFLRTL